MRTRSLTENANKTYHYGRINADSFTPYPKNPIIANFFNNIGRADELGSGVRNLYKYTKLYANGELVLFEDDVFKLEVPLNDFGDADVDKPLICVDKPLINGADIDIQERILLDYVMRNHEISNSAACKLLDLKSTRVRDILNNMVDKKLLVPIGELKSRRYIHADKNKPSI